MDRSQIHISALKPVFLLGLGKTGQAVAQFFLDINIPVYGADGNLQLLKNDSAIACLIGAGAFFCHDSTFVDMSLFQLLVISPGIPHSHPIIQKALHAGVRIVGEVELACSFLAHRRFLAITGTNGKTTVTLLVEHVLNCCGIYAKALGNVGVPLISEVKKANESDAVLVVELSSFQLETMNSCVIDAAVVLNITPDHLDRYASMQEYASTKIKIGNCLKPDGVWYIEERTLSDHEQLTQTMKRPFSYGFSSSSDLHTDGFQLFVGQHVVGNLPTAYRNKKNHDTENLLAAYALCHKMGVTGEQFTTALETFVKPSHRIEFVHEKNGIKYFDDSKGTNIDAVVKAVEKLRTESQAARIFLIAGGVDKGSPYVPWLSHFKDSVSAVYAIGQAAEKIKSDLGHEIPVEICVSLEDAVRAAASKAENGDYVLLSPGCSSFDMFKDYAHRGEEFKRIVKQL